MDLLDSMKVFVEAVDRGSLTAAAAACGISPTMAGNHLRALEQRAGASLLHRTTRRLNLTAFGESYYPRCQQILRLVEDSDRLADEQQARPAGVLRITAPVTFGAEALMPALCDYLALYPEVRVDLALCDRTVDLMDEGFEAAFRIGKLADADLVARPLAPYRTIVCAAPSYLARHGRPRTPDDLAKHECLGFGAEASQRWRFSKGTQEWSVPVKGRLKVNHGQALRMAAIHGAGIVRQPAVLLQPDVDAGRLVRLLGGYELPSRPLHLVYLHDRYRSARLRSFVDFALERFEG